MGRIPNGRSGGIRVVYTNFGKLHLWGQRPALEWGRLQQHVQEMSSMLILRGRSFWSSSGFSLTGTRAFTCRTLVAVAMLSCATTAAKAATFSEAGAQLNLDLNTANEVVAIVANATTYTLTLTGGTWSGTNSANVTGNGTASMTVTAAGLTAFNTIRLTDSATGTAATFNGSGANTYGDTFDITLDNAAGTITFNGASSFAGAASIAARTSRNISFAGGATLTAANGNIVLEANQQATASSGDFIGVNINAAVVQVTGTGALSVAGRGGDGASLQHGVQVRSGGDLIGGTSGLLTISGTGGAGPGTSNNGVYVRDANSSITSNGGPVTITGQGGGSGASAQNNGVALVLSGRIGAGSGGAVTVNGTGGVGTGLFNIGVSVTNSGSEISSSGGNVRVTGLGGGISGTEHFGVFVSADGQISAGGAGTVTVEGTGGTAGQINRGVEVRGANSRITSNGGAVSVTGQGGGTGVSTNNAGVLLNSGQIGAGGAGTTTVLGTAGATGVPPSGSYGVSAVNAAQINSAGGAVTVTGAGTSNSAAVNMEDTSAIQSGGNAAIVITADSVRLTPGAVNAGTGRVTLQPRTAGTLINLGGADVLNGSPLTLGLTDAELDQVTAGTLEIGNSTSGPLTVSTDMTRPVSTAMSLISGGDVVVSGGQVNTGGGTLLLDPGLTPAAVKPVRALTDATASTVSFGSDLNIVINGTTLDAQYSQLNVAGSVNLTGVDLVLSGAFAPGLGDVFTIVSASSVTGTFNGLADGASIPFNDGRVFRINYTGTSVTLTVTAVPVELQSFEVE